MGYRLSKRFVDATRPSDKDAFYWDDDLKGFGLKVSPKGLKSYVVQYRTPGGRNGRARRITIGRHGSPWTVEEARAEAKRILGDVAHGSDPMDQRSAQKANMSVSELCDLYLGQGVATKKASTVATDNGRIERHIKPLIGKMPISEVDANDIRSMMVKIAEGRLPKDSSGYAPAKLGGKGTAARTVGLLGGIFTFAIEMGFLTHNPVRGVKRYKDRKNERYLTREELSQLFLLADEHEANGANAKAIAIIKLLALTGARRGEIESLQWSEVSLAGKTLHLGDSKTGQKSIPVSETAMEILRSAERFRIPQNPHVFPAERGNGFYVGTDKVWQNLRGQLGDEQLRMHDLRHSFASMAVMNGASLPMIGALLGHRDTSTTQRYAHLKADPLRDISDQIGNSLLSDKTKQ